MNQAGTFNRSSSSKTQKLTAIAILGALATIIMQFETPIPFFPPFLKLDFSLVIVMVGGFLVGPVAVIPITFIKALVSFLSTDTGGVGELADFIISTCFAFPFAYTYKKMGGTGGLIIGCALGTISIAIAGAVANYFILLPFYSLTIPLDTIWALCAKINPIIVDLKSYIMYGAIPFNVVKGLIISAAAIIVIKALSNIPLIKSRNML